MLSDYLGYVKEPIKKLSNLFYGNRIKSPWKKSPRKIALNAVEREPVETKVLNPNASEASYKPKQRSYRKTKLKKYYFFILIFFRGDFILEPNAPYKLDFRLL